MMNHFSSRPWTGATASWGVSWGMLTISVMQPPLTGLQEEESETLGEDPVHGPQVDSDEGGDEHHRVGGGHHLLLGGPVHSAEFGGEILCLLLDGTDHDGPRGKDVDQKNLAPSEIAGAGKWQGRQASNPRPADLESAALPTELLPCGTARLLVEPGGFPYSRRPTWSRGGSYSNHRTGRTC